MPQSSLSLVSDTAAPKVNGRGTHRDRARLSPTSSSRDAGEGLEFAPPARPADEACLSRGELEAIESAAHGESVADAGRRLAKSPWTIRTQRNRALVKLGASNTAQAVYLAAKRGLI